MKSLLVQNQLPVCTMQCFAVSEKKAGEPHRRACTLTEIPARTASLLARSRVTERGLLRDVPAVPLDCADRFAIRRLEEGEACTLALPKISVKYAKVSQSFPRTRSTFPKFLSKFRTPSPSHSLAPVSAQVLFGQSTLPPVADRPMNPARLRYPLKAGMAGAKSSCCSQASGLWSRALSS